MFKTDTLRQMLVELAKDYHATGYLPERIESTALKVVVPRDQILRLMKRLGMVDA